MFVIHSHFQQTQHTYAMRLGTQRVWDYIGGTFLKIGQAFFINFNLLDADNYVHRIVQNKSDGKLVEVSGQQGMVSDDDIIMMS